MALPILALVLVLGALGAWITSDRWAGPPKVAVEDSASAMPSVPAIAVLPFLNLSGDPKQDYFSDGLTEDILTELSRARDLRVLARNTSFQYKGKAVDVGKLGRELGVRYVLEGSVQRSDDRLACQAQLIDTDTGTHIWADRYDREMADVFLVQDEIVNQIVAKIAGSYGVIEHTEASSAARRVRADSSLRSCLARARSDSVRLDSDTFRQAEDLLRQAIVLDPTNAPARRELAWFGVMGWVFRLDETPVPPDEIVDQAAKAVQLDPADARARMVSASAYFFTKQLDLCGRSGARAEACPVRRRDHGYARVHDLERGDHQRGVALAEKRTR